MEKTINPRGLGISHYNIPCSIIGIVVLLVFVFFYIRKNRKKYNNLNENEKELYNKFKSNIIKIGMICSIICLLITSIFSVYHFYNSKKDFVEMIESGYIVSLSTQYESKVLVVEQYLVVSIFICYLLFKFLIKINKNMSQEEKDIVKKVYSNSTLFLLIQTISILLYCTFVTLLLSPI